jgi:hypothetical protein
MYHIRRQKETVPHAIMYVRSRPSIQSTRWLSMRLSTDPKTGSDVTKPANTARTKVQSSDMLTSSSLSVKPQNQ